MRHAGIASIMASMLFAATACLLRTAARAQDATANEGGDLLIAGDGAGPGQFLELRDIAFDAKGVLYVLDGMRIDSKTKQAEGNLRIQKFSREGKLIGAIDLRDSATGQALGEQNDPQRIAVDSAGNVYVTQPAAGRVQQFSAEGKLAASFDIPRAIPDGRASNTTIPRKLMLREIEIFAAP